MWQPVICLRVHAFYALVAQLTLFIVSIEKGKMTSSLSTKVKSSTMS